MQCPKDNSFLKPQGKGRLQSDVCEKCGGFLVHLGQEAAAQLEKLLRKGLKDKTSGSNERAMVSPSTGMAMRGFEFRGVHLDYCMESHSVWFDRGEYQKILSVPGGGKRKPLKRERSPDASVWYGVDILGGGIEVAGELVGGGIEMAGDAIGGVGDFLGDLLGGVDLF